ncbi:cystatin-8 [Carlito syrichta]|uniref:Cystatin-8 n=1 Tax=Carlito syrichta TaxID=1868482 RepID=A0A1U7TX06_CARSF|nr:cystatin-8 [Carlito syrichta]
MFRPQWLSLLLLTIPVTLMASPDPEENEVKVLRELTPVDTSSPNVKQCLGFAMDEYNKESQDEYIFQVLDIQQAQLQVTHHLEYLIDVDIARSNCKKSYSNNKRCTIQEDSKLQKTATCSFLVGALPWNGKFTMMDKECEDA